MVEREYDERLLTCQDCGEDFLYSIDEQMRDDRDGRSGPRKCSRCRSGQKPQPARPQSSGRRPAGGAGGHGGLKQMYSEEYRSPSFPQDAAAEYRGPAFQNSDPGRHRNRAASSQGPRQPARSQSRQRYQIVCSHCGRSDTIPFRPSPSRPVYCHECYETHRYEEKKNGHGGKGREPGGKEQP